MHAVVAKLALAAGVVAVGALVDRGPELREAWSSAQNST